MKSFKKYIKEDTEIDPTTMSKRLDTLEDMIKDEEDVSVKLDLLAQLTNETRFYTSIMTLKETDKIQNKLKSLRSQPN